MYFSRNPLDTPAALVFIARDELADIDVRKNDLALAEPSSAGTLPPFPRLAPP
jgi:hypothetical protein